MIYKVRCEINQEEAKLELIIAVICSKSFIVSANYKNNIESSNF